MNGKFIQIKEAALILGVSKLTLRNWDNSGKLVAFRHPISNYRVYKSEDINNLIKKMESGEKPTTIKRSNSSSLSRKLSTPIITKTYNLKNLLQKDQN